MSASVKRPRMQLLLNGLPRRAYGVTTNSGTTGIQATFSIDPAEGSISPGTAVEISLGYVEGLNLAFSGVWTGDDTTLAPWNGEVRCGGSLKKINDRINVEDPTASEVPTTGVLPVLVDEGP